MSADDLLAELADGHFHSGQALADAQSISRTAIWKQVSALTELGLEIERVRGKGYRLIGGIELLDESLIRNGVSPEAALMLRTLSVFRRIDSTNTELLRRAGDPLGAQVCLAESQSAGRGRRGRGWVSPFGSSIYCSVSWQFSGGIEVLEGLSLAVGVILCESLEEFGVDSLELKWPNDVLRDGRKLAGILVEMTGDASGPCTAVIGMGVNVSVPQRVAGSIEKPWSDLSDVAEAGVSRNAIISRLLSRLLPALDNYEEAGFDFWRSRWMSRDAYADSEVYIESGGEYTSGVARGVNTQGALMLETEAGLKPVHGGEVSLRLR